MGQAPRASTIRTAHTAIYEAASLGQAVLQTLSKRWRIYDIANVAGTGAFPLKECVLFLANVRYGWKTDIRLRRPCGESGLATPLQRRKPFLPSAPRMRVATIELSISFVLIYTAVATSRYRRSWPHRRCFSILNALSCETVEPLWPPGGVSRL
jgi:hypothetical protein